MSRSFSITNNGQTLAATTSSQTFPIDASGVCPDVMIYNPGPNIVRVRGGGATQSAGTTSMPILAGEKSAYFKGSATHLAVIAIGGAQNVDVFVGEGT